MRSVYTMARKRKLKQGWLQAYDEYIIKQESPRTFHFWVGCQLISTVLKRHVYLDRGAYEVWPNLYIVLVAKSADQRKSTAMDIGLELLEDIPDIHIVHGRATIEGLMDMMNKNVEIGRPGTPNEGKARPDGSVLLHADELQFLLGRASYITDLMTFLTAAYTAKAKLDFLTRKNGLCKARNLYPGILTATTPEQMSEIFPSMALFSGFLGRVLLIYTDETWPRYAKPELKREMEESLIWDLGCINELEGEMVMTEKADKYFDDWYETTLKPTTPEMASFYLRKHDHVLKLAMILSISESDELILRLDHLQKAIDIIQIVEDNMPAAITYVGATARSHLTDLVEHVILSVAPEAIGHSVLLKRVYRKLPNGAADLAEVISDLKLKGRIEEIADKKGVRYRVKT